MTFEKNRGPQKKAQLALENIHGTLEKTQGVFSDSHQPSVRSWRMVVWGWAFM